MALGAASKTAQASLALMLTAFGAACSAHASPWARADGELLIISHAEYFYSDLTSQDPRGGRFESLDTDTYIEFGVTDDVTIGGKAIYGTSWLTNSAGTFTDTGFSEIEGYAQYQFARTIKHAASLRLSAGKPAAFQASARQAINNGADVELAALYGRNLTFAPLKTFTAVEVGYRKRFGAGADVIRSQVTLGAEPSQHWLLLLEGFSTVSLRNEKPGGADYDIVKIQPSLVYRINRRWAVQAGMNEEVTGRNLALGRTFFIGLWSAF
ncbi:hypothetical protein [Hyphococcus luteus]|uniref:Transporter n=1 Tax=Hyphococcus luteus TaxID=2058213 RepID=A0A2S7KAW8_9PROT|nr:hypothetical protein [Marinicaulis flavus]PQA89654.1 hypothetical protein CW354_01980 [Marinicaulis flavus]